MLNCKKVTELCSRELERPLSLGERAAVGTHLMMCSGCSNFRKQMRVLRSLANSYASGNAPPADSEDNGAGGDRRPV